MISRALSGSPQRRRLRISQAVVGAGQSRRILEEVRHVPYIFHSYLHSSDAFGRRGADWAECIENIDIGGPALIRAAAKNHDWVTVVTDPSDYDAVLAEIELRLEVEIAKMGPRR